MRASPVVISQRRIADAQRGEYREVEAEKAKER
jgi:hypothetical protein